MEGKSNFWDTLKYDFSTSFDSTICETDTYQFEWVDMPPCSFRDHSPSDDITEASEETVFRNSDLKPNAKLPIPRIQSSGIRDRKNRASRACESCREHKAKCSGEHPTCQRCEWGGIECRYGDRKRERTEKFVSKL